MGVTVAKMGRVRCRDGRKRVSFAACAFSQNPIATSIFVANLVGQELREISVGAPWVQRCHAPTNFCHALPMLKTGQIRMEKATRAHFFVAHQKVRYNTAQPNDGCVGQGMEGE